MRPNQSVAIIGGGIAGLTAAHALASVGIRADIYESARQLTEVGAAIAISPQAYKAVQAIGLEKQLLAVATPSPNLYTRNMQTGEFVDLLNNEEASKRFGGPFYTFHRADLIEALAVGLDPATIHLGHRLATLEEKKDTVHLSFSNGASIEADFVIGADGIRSVVRQAIYGDDHPSYTGQMVWRAILKGKDIPPGTLDPTGWVQWVGPGCHFMAYYMRGKELVNVVTQEDTGKWVAEGWSTPGDPDEMRLSFPNPEPRLKKLLSIITDCSKWGLFTRPLTDNWGRGRIQLIGDAAHAMLPNIGQGACQAFEDGYILARWLDETREDMTEGFRNFRRVRIPRVHVIQRMSLLAAKRKHMQDPSAQKALLESSEGLHGNMGWVLGYNPLTDWRNDPVMPPADSVVHA